MNAKNEMGGFRENALKNYNQACIAFSAANKCAPIERVTGVKKLGDKLNPGQDHKLTALELQLITKESGDYSMINSMLLSLDMVAVNVDRIGDDATLVNYALEASKNSGEISAITLANGGTTRLPRRTSQKLLATCHAGIANLVLLANDLENRTTGVTPFLSLATDFVIQNGAPGLV